MRLLVISDTHKHLGRVIDLLETNHSFDGIIHLGDLVSDAQDIEAFSGLPVDAVAGNCDWVVPDAPYNRVVEVAGKRLYLCHGHQEQVKYGEEVLRRLARDEGYDAVLYGHTHMVSEGWEGDCLIMNPGSISLPRDGAPSYGILHIDGKGIIHSNIVRLEN